LDGRTTATESDITTNTADIATNTAAITVKDATVDDHEQRILSLETEVPVPDPDPTDPPTWAATLAPNKLVADIFVNNFTTKTDASWALEVDDEWSGSPTYPTNFTAGSTVVGTVAGWSAEVWRLYQYDSVDGVTEILTSTGDSGITITPVAYVIDISDFDLAIGTPDTSAFTASWTDLNIVNGTHTLLKYDILNFDDIPVRSDVTSPEAFSDQNSGTTYSLKVKATYISGQETSSNVDSITTVSSGIGIVTIEQPPSARDIDAGSGGHEIDEDAGGNLSIDVVLDTPVESGTVTVEYRFVDDTAAEGTDYDDDYAGTEGTLTWAESETVQSIELDPTDLTSVTNRCCQLELIDNDQKTTGLEIDKTQYDYAYGNAVLLYINGTGGGTEGFVQNDAEGNGIISIDLSNANSTDVPDPLESGSELVNNNATSGAVNDNYIEVGRYGSYKSLTPEDADYVGNAPRREFLCNFTKAETEYTFHVRYRSSQSSTNDECSIDVDDGLESTLRAFEIFNPEVGDRTLHGWAFTHTDAWTAGGQTGTSRTLTIAPGQHTISINQYDAQMRADTLVITSNSSYDPATIGQVGDEPSRDDNYGPPESTYGAGGGDATDAEANLLFPNKPIDPDVSLIAPSSYFPTDGSTVDYKTSLIVIQYDTASSIEDLVMRMYSWDGADTGTSVEISGTATVTGSALNNIEFAPTNQLGQDADYYVTVDGSALNASSIRAPITFGSSTAWNFTTTEEAVTGLVDQVTFDNHTTNVRYTPDMADADFRTMTSVAKLTTSANGTYIDDDPAGNPARGKVLRILWEGTRAQLGNHTNFYHHFDTRHYNLKPQTSNMGGIDPTDYPMSNEACGTTNNPGITPVTTAAARESEHTTAVGLGDPPWRFDELHMAFDVYFPADWKWINYHKFPGMVSGTSLTASHGRYAVANREGYYGCTSSGYLAAYEWGSGWDTPNPSPNIKTGAFGGYIYHTDRVQWNQWCNTSDPTKDPVLASDHYYMPLGKWVSIEYRMKMNTTNTDSTSIYGSADWIGPGRWYWPDWANEIGIAQTNVRREGPQAGDLIDGVWEIWVQEQGDSVAKLILTRTVRYRLWEYLKITQGYPRFSNNPDTRTRPSLPRVDQSYWIDNFRWKEGPILPRTA